MKDLHTEINLDEKFDRTVVPALKAHPIVLGDTTDEPFAAGVADMDFRVALPILNALQERLGHGIFGYEAVPGGLLPALENWLLTRHNWQVNHDHILRAPNVLNSLSIALSLFTVRNDGVIVQPPVFFDFYDIIRENGRQLVSNPLILEGGRYRMDFEGLQQLAEQTQNTMLFLCNPHNPVGRVWHESELRTLGEICNKNDVLVISDEIHGDITFRDHPYTPFASLGADFASNSITCISPAKCFNIAACCSAFTIVPDDEKRAAFQAENSRLTVNKNNAFASVAMEAAYAHAGSWLDEVLIYLEDNVELVRSRLASIPGVELVEPEGTFLLWLDFRKLMIEPGQLNVFLRQEAGWAVTNGQAFGEQGGGFARLNIACPRAKLATALHRLKTAIAER